MGARLKIGCCGFAASREKYFEAFNAVEIQTTFYHPPSVKTAHRWRSEAPAGFEYTMKAWQLITHEPSSPTYRRFSKAVPSPAEDRFGSLKPTFEVAAAWETTRSIAAAVGARIVVFQCPAGFAPTEENKANLRRFFKAIDRDGFVFVWEPRGRWRDEEVEGLCSELNLVRCATAIGPSRPAAGFQYVRLGGESGYRYKHTDADLRSILESYDLNVPTYFMFNNISMFQDASRMKALVEASGPDR